MSTDERPHDDSHEGRAGRAHEAPASHVAEPHFPPEPPLRRVRQYAFMVGLAILAVVCGVWLIFSYASQREQAQEQAQAAKNLCRQLVGLGQNCVAAPGEAEGVSNQAAVPAPTGALTGSALPPSLSPGQSPPTDENGVPLAFQPAADALIVAVGVDAGRLVLSFSDGARLDAGPVNEQVLSIVLKQLSSASPSPVPSLSPSPSPYNVWPPGADAPDPPQDYSTPPTPEETP